MSENLEQLIDEHWQYVEKTLIAHGVAEEHRKIAKWHYKSAWVHGVKHERERRGMPKG